MLSEVTLSGLFLSLQSVIANTQSVFRPSRTGCYAGWVMRNYFLIKLDLTLKWVLEIAPSLEAPIYGAVFKNQIPWKKHIYWMQKRKASTKTPLEDRGDRPWEVLYGGVVDLATSRTSVENFCLFAVMGKNVPFCVSGVDGCWQTCPLALAKTILCLAVIFGTLL